jgi:hypothetical protein
MTDNITPELEAVARAICRPVWATCMPNLTDEALNGYVEMNWANHIDQADASSAGHSRAERLNDPSCARNG